MTPPLALKILTRSKLLKKENVKPARDRSTLSGQKSTQIFSAKELKTRRIMPNPGISISTNLTDLINEDGVRSVSSNRLEKISNLAHSSQKRHPPYKNNYPSKKRRSSHYYQAEEHHDAPLLLSGFSDSDRNNIELMLQDRGSGGIIQPVIAWKQVNGELSTHTAMKNLICPENLAYSLEDESFGRKRLASPSMCREESSKRQMTDVGIRTLANSSKPTRLLKLRIKADKLEALSKSNHIHLGKSISPIVSSESSTGYDEHENTDSLADIEPEYLGTLAALDNCRTLSPKHMTDSQVIKTCILRLGCKPVPYKAIGQCLQLDFRIVKNTFHSMQKQGLAMKLARSYAGPGEEMLPMKKRVKNREIENGFGKVNLEDVASRAISQYRLGTHVSEIAESAGTWKPRPVQIGLSHSDYKELIRAHVALGKPFCLTRAQLGLVPPPPQAVEEPRYAVYDLEILDENDQLVVIRKRFLKESWED